MSSGGYAISLENARICIMEPKYFPAKHNDLWALEDTLVGRHAM